MSLLPISTPGWKGTIAQSFFSNEHLRNRARPGTSDHGGGNTTCWPLHHLASKSTLTGHVKGYEDEKIIAKTFCEEAKTASLLEVMSLKRTSTLLQDKYKPDQISSKSIEIVNQTDES